MTLTPDASNLPKLLSQAIARELDFRARAMKVFTEDTVTFLNFNHPQLNSAIGHALPALFLHLEQLRDTPPSDAEKAGDWRNSIYRTLNLEFKNEPSQPVPMPEIYHTELMQARGFFKMGASQGVKLIGAGTAMWLEALTLLLEKTTPAELQKIIGTQASYELVAAFQLAQLITPARGL